MRSLRTFVQSRPILALVLAATCGVMAAGAFYGTLFLRSEYAQWNAVRTWAVPKIIQERQQQLQRAQAPAAPPRLPIPSASTPTPTPAPPPDPERK